MAVAHGLQSRDIELNAQLVRRYLIGVAELQQHSYDTVRLFRGGKVILSSNTFSRNRPKTWASSQTPMKHGRIVRVSERQGYTTYIVAEEDAAKAEPNQKRRGTGTGRAVNRPRFVETTRRCRLVGWGIQKDRKLLGSYVTASAKTLCGAAAVR
jgi:hypothetical protein